MNIFEYFNQSADYNRQLNLSTPFLRYLKSIPVSNNTSSRSRTFANVMYQTFGRFQYNWYNTSTETTGNMYCITSACCAALYAKLNNYTPKGIIFRPYYLSPDEINSNAISALDAVPNTNSRYLCDISVYYVPRGRTQLDAKLSTYNAVRLPQFETILISSISHYIRVYKSEPNRIVIYTNVVSENLISLIYTLLPKILNIKELENPNNDKEITEYNTAVNAVLLLHEIAYNSVYNQTLPELSIPVIKECLATLSKLWINTNTLCNDFINNFANRRNTTYSRYLVAQEERCMQNIADYEKRLEQYYNTLGDLQHKRLLLKHIQPDDVKPFINALNNNPQIETLDTTNTKLTLRITAPLQYYDAEDYKAYVDNPNSNVNKLFSTEEKALLYDIFINKRYVILLQSIISLDLVEDSSESTIKFNAHTYCKDLLTEMPNPHLYYYNCWSEARTVLAKAIANNEYDTIVPQLIAAVQSINVAESASFISHFLYDLKDTYWRNKIHLIEVSTQTKYTFETLLKQYENPPITVTEEKEPEHIEEPQKTNQYTQIILSEDDDMEDTL